jgi:hypothetical protein
VKGYDKKRFDDYSEHGQCPEDRSTPRLPLYDLASRLTTKMDAITSNREPVSSQTILLGSSLCVQDTIELLKPTASILWSSGERTFKFRHLPEIFSYAYKADLEEGEDGTAWFGVMDVSHMMAVQMEYEICSGSQAE